MRFVQVIVVILLVLLVGIAVQRARVRGHQQPLAAASQRGTAR
jgi:hypothetical protein